MNEIIGLERVKVIKIGGGVLGVFENFEENFQYINNLILREKNDCEKLIVVFSAFKGITRKLSDIAIYTDHRYPGSKMFDKIVSDGENNAVKFLYQKFSGIDGFERLGCFYKENIPIITDNMFGNANITMVNSYKILNMLKDYDILFMPGFVGISVDHLTTTLGSNGSDTTCIAVASAVDGQCVIIKDTGSVYTADPKVVANAVKLNALNLMQANILASLGSEVIHAKGASYAFQTGIPIYLRSIDGSSETVISKDASLLPFAGVTFRKVYNGTMLSIVGEGIDPYAAYDALKEVCSEVEYFTTTFEGEASSVIVKTDNGETIKECLNTLHQYMIA